ncbi:MAG: hypothetical protein ACKVWR_01875 [Acidimicrobiales bacterium]
MISTPCDTTAIAVVLVTDLVASTQLRSEIGEDAADELIIREQSRAEAIVQAHGGVLVKGLGDGVLAVFDSATRALQAALAIRADTGHPIRAGLSVGEVTWHRGDCFGSAVIEAARLVGAAAPGEILVADQARQIARGRSGLSFASRGELALKGLPQPVATWSLLGRTSTAAVAPTCHGPVEAEADRRPDTPKPPHWGRSRVEGEQRRQGRWPADGHGRHLPPRRCLPVVALGDAGINSSSEMTAVCLVGGEGRLPPVAGILSCAFPHTMLNQSHHSQTVVAMGALSMPLVVEADMARPRDSSVTLDGEATLPTGRGGTGSRGEGLSTEPLASSLKHTQVTLQSAPAAPPFKLSERLSRASGHGPVEPIALQPAVLSPTYGPPTRARPVTAGVPPSIRPDADPRQPVDPSDSDPLPATDGVADMRTYLIDERREAVQR